MQSAKVILVQFLLVACLAGLVLSAPTEQNGIAMTPELCEQFAQGVKMGITSMKQNSAVMCSKGSPEEQQLCRDALEATFEKFESKTPEQLCAEFFPEGKVPDVSQIFSLLGLPGLPGLF